jgi:hypothetical protein
MSCNESDLLFFFVFFVSRLIHTYVTSQTKQTIAKQARTFFKEILQLTMVARFILVQCTEMDNIYLQNDYKIYKNGLESTKGS